MNSSFLPKIPRLSARDRQIIEHVGRYRLTTVDALRAAVLKGLSRNATAKVANRLCATSYLQKHTLLHPTRYFVLADRGASLLGMGAHRAAPLGPQSLPQEYAVLVYATLSRQPRTRLTKREVLSKFPWLSEPLADAPHCVEERTDVLELIRVDLGGPADHVARKTARELNERLRLREFWSLIAEGQFRLTVITATKEKAAAIRRALDRHDWPVCLPIHLSVVPHLLSLSARQKHA